MNAFTAVAIYLTLWWVTLFAVLPLGMRSHHEDDRPVPGGGDPGSPVAHNMRRKLCTTTWISAALFAVLMVVLRLIWPAAQPI